MEPWLPALADAVAAELASGRIQDKGTLQRAKQRHARRLGTPRLPRDSELLASLPADQQQTWASMLRQKPMRSQSGVAIVAVMSSPAACPHGKCVYCPGGPDAGVPQSYTGHEPSTMRAIRFDYDAYRIVRSRLAHLQGNGHPIDKVEVVVQGGTFPARDEAYQDHFIASIYEACNHGPEPAQAVTHDAPPAPDAATSPARQTKPDAWDALDAAARADALAELQRRNEGAACRVIGLTVETKPDWCFEPHVDAMLRHGTTRIELGVQTLSEQVTLLTNRGHTVADARRAMQVARDAGFKVCVHMMPGLPRPQAEARSAYAAGRQASSDRPVLPRPGGARGTGSSGVLEEHSRVPGLPRPQPEATRDPEPRGPLAPRTGPPVVGPDGSASFIVDPAADVDDIRVLFADPDFRPDMLKIYPTLVVQEGETTLKRWWREGRFRPMDTALAVDVVAEALRHVPEYCRIQRVDRDIPTTHVLAGVMNSNLRQLAEGEARRRGIRLRDIRAREVGTRIREGASVDVERLELVTRCYEASGGEEAFISLEDAAADALVGFVRVRRIGASHRGELCPLSAVVRELKVYGAAQRLGEHDAAAWQHKGLGARLLAAAEHQAFSTWGVPRLAVLAGPGVKEYYRRHGYSDLGPYVAKAAP